MGQHTHQKSPDRFTSSWASVHFDLFRGVAALVVLLEHWRNLFFVDFPQLSAHRLWLAIPYTLCGAGHQSVVFFFVLSGFFIGGSVFRAIDANHWKWSDYLLRRFVRLWTVLLPALLFCLFWDRLGIHLARAPALYAGLVPNHMLSDVAPLLAPHLFFGNLFFLQTILCPVFGSDGALWSLANEFWYYILFPLACIALWRRAARSHRIACAVLFVAVACFVRNGILSEFPIWLAGAALVKLPRPSFTPHRARSVRIAAALIYFPIFFALGRLHQIPSLFSDYILAALTLALLWLFLSHKEAFAPGSRRVLASREMARFSYTLYAAHTPFLVFAASLILGDRRWVPSLANLPLALAVLLASLVYCYGVGFLTEFRTDSIRSTLARLLGMHPPPPVLPSNPLSDLAAPAPR